MSERPLALAEDLLTAMHQSPLPFALLDAEAQKVMDANAPARELLGWNERDPRDAELSDLISPDQIPSVVDALKLLADGGIDMYEARRKFLRLDGEVLECHVWVHSVRDVMRYAAVSIFSPDHPCELIPPDFDMSRMAPVHALVVGSLDLELRVARISSDTQELLGIRADALAGMSFVELLHPDDVASFLMAVGRALSQAAGVGLQLRVRDASGSYVHVRTLITPLRGGTTAHLGIVLTPANLDGDDTGERSSDLEHRLWRIALEVQAAGVMDALHAVPDHPQLPATHDLSSRQWEVLARLQRGERVPGIAREMFLSQSTVRNHLAAIFRKTGVHSQAELLALMRENRQSV